MLTMAHVVEDFSAANTGVTAAARELIELMRRHGVASTVFAAGNGAVTVMEGIRTASAPLVGPGRI